MTSRVGDMTLEELRTVVEAIVVDKMEKFTLIREGLANVRRLPGDQPDNRTYEEVLASIERNRWTPPPGAKSSLELLREDRDR